MKVFVVVSSLLAVAAAAPHLLTPQVYAAIPATTIITAPAELTSQFHAQDELGQYSYGYNGGLSAKTEAKSLDGVTRGSYSYVDPENKVQTVTYTADSANGFRAEASNMPVAPVETRIAPEPVQDTPEVSQAKAEHLAAVEETKLRNAAADKADEEEKSSVVVDSVPTAAIAPVTSYTAAAPAIALTPASRFAYSTSSLALKNKPLAITTYAAPAPLAAVEIRNPAYFSYSTYTHAAPAAIQYSAAPALQLQSLPVSAYSLNVQAPGYAYSYNTPAFITTPHVAPTVIDARSAAPLPEPVPDTPEVAKAKAEHLQIVAETKARDEQ
ncbi:cuticle protein 19.8-like [Toxorhynchites rutilus septentrionalis]|uniref:cuticle protein 19.8-like n=1 Tax=Toxorhynchites rutilus septentrionalis TaxID=329112 RepID=UPI00247B2D15|nr:cuticle protein 19.8-like [Toxorhynchites rutilus septentrionalis]